MDVSKFLSKVIGIYLMIITIIMFVDMPQFVSRVDLLIHDVPLLFVTGFFTLIVGLLMVVSHNVWQWNWRVIITLMAWLALFKGFSLLLFPQFIDQTTLLFLQSSQAQQIVTYFDFVLGVMLTYFGFKRDIQER